MDGLGFNALAFSPARFKTGGGVFNPGFVGPRTNLESQGSCVRPWPTIYTIPARGLGAMPTFQLGPTLPVFNNRLAGGAPGYNIMMPGLGKTPFGG
jgi:hypothetical protein